MIPRCLFSSIVFCLSRWEGVLCFLAGGLQVVVVGELHLLESRLFSFDSGLISASSWYSVSLGLCQCCYLIKDQDKRQRGYLLTKTQKKSTSFNRQSMNIQDSKEKKRLIERKQALKDLLLYPGPNQVSYHPEIIKSLEECHKQRDV